MRYKYRCPKPEKKMAFGWYYGLAIFTTFFIVFTLSRAYRLGKLPCKPPGFASSTNANASRTIHVVTSDNIHGHSGHDNEQPISYSELHNDNNYNVGPPLQGYNDLSNYNKNVTLPYAGITEKPPSYFDATNGGN